MSVSKVNPAIVPLLFALLLGCSERERLAIKAQTGNAAAMREYGNWICEKGHDSEYREGMVWLRKAAEKGDTQAMYDYAMAKGGGGIQPHPEAVFWFRKGAEAGDPNCMGKLAEAYRYGFLGLDKDEKQYRYWMDKAMAIDRDRSNNYGR